MPCESCQLQFSVFRRKRSCSECRRLYCQSCLVKRKEKILCDRCVVFTTRPISKIDLLKLKPKDLIFYLQSKHISTTGCVEKEELVELVLIYVNNSNSFSDNSNRSSTQFSDDNFSNPFDQIKQTCQNLFTSFTDKIASDLSFDTKPSPSGQNENIFSQPRASSTSPQQQYSFSNSTSESNVHVQQQPVDNHHRPTAVPIYNHTTHHRSSNASSGHTSPISPVISAISSSSSLASTPTTGLKPDSIRSSQRKGERQPINTPTTATSNRNEELPSVHEKIPKIGVAKVKPKVIDQFEFANSECECSDDETISKFTKEYMKTSPSTRIEDQLNDEPEAGPSRNASKTSSTETKTKDDSSNTSSFEELGASGVSSNDWLLIGRPSDEPPRPINTGCEHPQDEDVNPLSNINLTNLTFQNVPTHYSQQNIYPGTSSFDQQRVRRLVRRRSDGVIYNSSVSKMSAGDAEEEMSEDETSRKKSKTSSCDKCGKSKRNLKRQVAKFKRQLETTNASETEIKKQLEAFLEYLETSNKNSFDCTDSESNDGRIANDEALRNGEITDLDQSNDDDDDDNYDFDYDEGIHVYGTDHDETKSTPRQFVDINDYENSSDLDDLTVKQLKEILMLNRVDFKGCCEKSELLERVKRLWNELNSCPAIDKLPTDDLCKICMDAPIECVILECGHMATCTGCGKVLSECPICRQYIVRVVRFFRA